MKTCYAVIETRSFNGAEGTISLVVDDTGSQYFSFSSPEEARAWIRKLAGRKDYLRQNDSHPSIFAVTEVGSKNFYDAYKCTWARTLKRYPIAFDCIRGHC